MKLHGWIAITIMAAGCSSTDTKSETTGGRADRLRGVIGELDGVSGQSVDCRSKTTTTSSIGARVGSLRKIQLETTLDPGAHSVAWLTWAQTLEERDPVAAIGACRCLLWLRPDSTEAWINFGRLDAHYNLATLLDQSGDSRSALRHIKAHSECHDPLHERHFMRDRAAEVRPVAEKTS